jgi:mRNA-degrading endonuclease RelE of RelBE toxin-antitoxin system
MAKRKIIWSRVAVKKLYSILEKFIRSKKSRDFCSEVFKEISKEVSLLGKHPDYGIRTTEQNIFALISGSYILFYEVQDGRVIIHTISERKE